MVINRYERYTTGTTPSSHIVSVSVSNPDLHGRILALGPNFVELCEIGGLSRVLSEMDLMRSRQS